jgi:hypothetical protein
MKYIECIKQLKWAAIKGNITFLKKMYIKINFCVLILKFKIRYSPGIFIPIRTSYVIKILSSPLF